MTAPASQADQDFTKQAAAAENLLLEQVFLPTFLQKMAQRGFPCANDQEAADMLEAARMLEHMPDEQLYGKQAEVASRYAAPVAAAYDVLGLRGQVQAKQAEAAAYDKAAELLTKVPDLSTAALLLHLAEQPA